MTENVQRRFFSGVVVTVLLAGYVAYWLPSCAGGSRWGLGKTIREARQILSGLESYRTELGAYPEGDSVAILSALGGENSSHSNYLHAPPGVTNSAGFWLDAWGTPYEVSVAMPAETGSARPGPSSPLPSPMVKSAGPNKAFGDADDIMVDWNKLRSSNKQP